MGHVRDLPKGAAEIPAAVKKEKWSRIGVNTTEDFEPLYIVPKDKKKVVKELKDALKGATQLLLATDEDREGESISWHLLQILKPKIPTKRMVFHEITKKAINKALDQTREIDMELVQAQETRSILDRLFGYELSPLLWKKVAPRLSAGRVQSVSVRLLVRRERERRSFKKASYWGIKASLVKDNITFETKLFSLNGKRISNGSDFDEQTGELKEGNKSLIIGEEQVNELLKTFSSEDWLVSKIEKKPSTRKPVPPFTTSTLQQEAYRKLRLSARETMRCAQGLYERGFITYMRTDSVHLSEHAIGAARESVSSKYGKEYLSNSPRQFNSTARNAQEAHEAIRPAGEVFKTPKETNLTGRDLSLYDLIWKRTVASQMAEARLTMINAEISVGDGLFKSSGKSIDFPGFFRAYVEGSDDPSASLEQQEIILPNLTTVSCLEVTYKESTFHETIPPARYTEAALVKVLEKEGIGRPSTYANIISTIQDRGYVQIENKRFFVKKIGHIVAERLIESFHDIMDYDFTANLENSLDEVANGEADWRNVLDNFYKSFQNDLLSASDEDSGMRPGNIPTTTDIVCVCGKTNMVIRNSSNGVFLGCSGYQNEGNDKCKETLNLISGDEAVSVDDSEEAENLLIKKRCPKCDTSMDNYLIDEFRKLHVCGKNPDCNGYLVEDGKFKIKGYDGPTLECHKCGSEMQLKTGRFGKYFGCLNDNCGATRALQRNGEPKPITMEPIEMPDLKCIKCEDHYLLRDSMKGLFLAASQYPKNRETRAPKVSEINKLHNEIVEACRFLPNKEKHMYLLEAPENDVDGNPYIIRYNRTDDVHYLASEKDGKKTKWTATYSDGEWIQNLKS